MPNLEDIAVCSKETGHALESIAGEMKMRLLARDSVTMDTLLFPQLGHRGEPVLLCRVDASEFHLRFFAKHARMFFEQDTARLQAIRGRWNAWISRHLGRPMSRTESEAADDAFENRELAAWGLNYWVLAVSRNPDLLEKLRGIDNPDPHAVPGPERLAMDVGLPDLGEPAGGP